MVFAGDIFVGSLVFIAAFMCAYRGNSWPENYWATFGGVCALFVALFPASGSGCGEQSFLGRGAARFIENSARHEWEPVGTTFFQSAVTILGFPALENTFHVAAAAGLFLTMSVLCIVFFRTDSGWRDKIYFLSGWAIFVLIVIIGGANLSGFLRWDEFDLTFWLEYAALTAFGVAWIAKGRAYPALTGLVGKLPK